MNHLYLYRKTELDEMTYTCSLHRHSLRAFICSLSLLFASRCLLYVND